MSYAPMAHGPLPTPIFVIDPLIIKLIGAGIKENSQPGEDLQSVLQGGTAKPLYTPAS